jgi:hypothetical protein
MGACWSRPFSFYRGTAKIMAADLAGTPTAGLQVQLCGDAHLSNFGLFASPERRLLFDLNDFDETLPGPFEYDVKRMAASFTIAARNNAFANADTRAATLVSVAAYREAMAGFAAMGTLDIWYAHLDEDELLKGIRGATVDPGPIPAPRELVPPRDSGGGGPSGTSRRDLGPEVSPPARPVFRFSSYAVVVRLPGSWLRWLAPATQWPMSSRAAIPTQNQSHPINPRPGV